MSLLHEKRSAPIETDLRSTEKTRQTVKPVGANITRNPRSERFSVTLDGWSLLWLLAANAAVVLSALTVIVGGGRV